jgi:hypothetical protein
MAKYYEATFLASEGMLQCETGFTTVTDIWKKVRWFDAVSHEEGITELLGGELRPVDSRRED